MRLFDWLFQWMRRAQPILLPFRPKAPPFVPMAPIPAAGEIEVYFSPQGGCMQAAVREVAKAQKTIAVLAYYFTAEDLATALVEAAKRQVEVKVILDKAASKEHGCQGPTVKAGGGQVWTDDTHRIAHNKVIVIDGHTVLTGSFNWTASAEYHNAENLLILRGCEALAQLYLTNWAVHQSHSEPLV